MILLSSPFTLLKSIISLIGSTTDFWRALIFWASSPLACAVPATIDLARVVFNLSPIPFTALVTVGELNVFSRLWPSELPIFLPRPPRVLSILSSILRILLSSFSRPLVSNSVVTLVVPFILSCDFFIFFAASSNSSAPFLAWDASILALILNSLSCQKSLGNDESLIV